MKLFLRLIARSFVSLLALLAFLLAASCDDDSGPLVPDELWEPASLADPPSQGSFYSLAFFGTRGLAAGEGLEGAPPTAVHSPYLAARMSDDSWARLAGVLLPPHSVLSAVGFAPSGEGLVSGADFDTQSGFILDERNGWSRHDFAFGGQVFAAGAAIVRVAGFAADSNVVLKSSAPDIWTAESLPFPGNGEHGITDISARDGVFVACGFDDGGDGSPEFPNSVLFRDEGSGWVRIEADCGGCSNREFKAVAVRSSGFYFLGGAVTDFSSGASDPYRAFLLFSSGAGNWAEVILPEPGVLDRVNDILIAANGDVYLACGVEGSMIVRLPVSSAGEREATLPMTRITTLGEALDGSVWAAGAILDGAGQNSRPMLWKRVPR